MVRPGGCWCSLLVVVRLTVKLLSNDKSSTASNDKSCIGKESTIASNKRGFEDVDQHGNINLHQRRKSARVSKPNPKYQNVNIKKRADV